MKYNSIGEQLIAKAQELDPNYKPDKFNDMSEAIDVILNKTGSSGGDIWLDIAPYLSEDERSISQEGYDLVYNAFSPESLNPNNKYAGILWWGYTSILNEVTISGKKSFNFIANVDSEEGKFSLKVSINDDKSVEAKGEISSSSSVFDITPYLTSETSISVEGYNALKEFITSNKGSMIKVTLGSMGIMYFNCTSISNNNVINLSQCDFAGYEGTIRTVSLGNDGVFALDGSDFVRVTPNASNPTSILTTIGIGGDVYAIPTGNDYSTEISTLNGRIDSLNNDVAQLLSYNIDSLDSRITQLENDISIINSLDSRINDLENTIIKDIPPLPSDANTKTYTLKSVNGVLTWSA